MEEEEALIVVKIRVEKSKAYLMKEDLSEILDDFFFTENDAELEGDIEIKDL